jgi:3-hydroxybutyryl-CoA dehydratase
MNDIAPRSARSLQVGTELRAAPRLMTRERMRWYVDAQATVAADDGRIHRGGPTIHDDDDYAKSQGLPGIIADGMVSTNWLFALLVETFGRAFAERGRLRTKYIAPVYEDDSITSCARVTSIDTTPSGDTVYGLELWCETAPGTKVTVGDATVYLPHRCA